MARTAKHLIMVPVCFRDVIGNHRSKTGREDAVYFVEGIMRELLATADDAEQKAAVRRGPPAPGEGAKDHADRDAAGGIRTGRSRREAVHVPDRRDGAVFVLRRLVEIRQVHGARDF